MDRYTHPVGFWFYVGGCCALLALGWVGIATALSSVLLKFMAFGLLLIAARFLLGPSTLDLTGWTLTVMALLPLGLMFLLGSPIVYALWVTFVGSHVDIQFH